MEKTNKILRRLLNLLIEKKNSKYHLSECVNSLINLKQKPKRMRLNYWMNEMACS